MMAVLSALSAPLSTLAATAAKKPSGSSATLLILIVIAAGVHQVDTATRTIVHPNGSVEFNGDAPGGPPSIWR